MGKKSTELLDRGQPEQVVCFFLFKMASLDLSWASLGVDENDLMCVDPLAAAQALKRAINRLTDGEVVIAALRSGLNVRSDAMIVRNRLERHKMRRYFGNDAAPWDATRDEQTAEPPSTPSPSSSSRHSVANLSSSRVSPQAEVVTSIPNREPLSTGQSIECFRDPISMEVPSPTFMSQIHIEVNESGCVITEATAGSHVAPTVPCADALEAPGYHEPPFMSSVSVTENPFSAGVSQASGCGVRAEPPRSHFSQPVPPASLYYPSGYPSHPSHPSYLSYPEYIPKSFSYVSSAVPPPAVTGFSSFPANPAASFQPHDGRVLRCVDSVAAAQARNRAINKMTDGEVAISALRPERKGHFGSGTAPWNPVLDERSEMLEPRHISSSFLNSGNLVGNVSRARVLEIPTSTGIFRSEISTISDLALERRGSTVAADEISDRSKLNHQPHAQSTRCPLRFIRAISSCCSRRSMDVTRVVSVPITVPSCSTAESAPIHARPTCCSTFFSPTPAPSLESVRVVRMSNRKFNAAPAVVSNPSLSRSCSRLSFERDNKVIPPLTKLSPSLLSSEGFVRHLNVSPQSEVLSYRAPVACKCSMSTKQRGDSRIKFKGMLSQLKLPLRLGQQLTRPCRTRSLSDRPYPARELLGIFRKRQRLKGKELWHGQSPVYQTPPPPDESFFPLNHNAILMLRRQAKLASVKLTGSELLPINRRQSLAAVSPVSVAKADLSPITGLREWRKSQK